MNEENKKYESHGNNWSAFTDNFDTAKIIELAKTVVEDKKSIFKKNGDFLGTIGFESPLRVLALSLIEKENAKLYSLYPFFQVSNPVNVEISKIHEWSNKGEAVIEGSIGGVAVNFFDTLYFLNKEKYKIGGTYQFNISGLAHSFTKRTKDLQFVADSGPIKGEKFDTTRVTSYIPNHVFGGEFSYYSPFESFSGIVESLGSKFYHYPFYLRNIEDGIAFSFPLFVREQILGDYKPEINDPIAGTGWLQGYLIGSL